MRICVPNHPTLDFGSLRPLARLFPALLAVCLASGAPSALAQRTSAYRIGARDVLRIDISTRSDLSTQYTVTDAGTITVQGLGLVRAAGLTSQELADDLARRFSLVDRQIPRVTVTVIEARAQQVAVLGAVALPGLYNLRENGTAWSSIEQAGGALDDADLTAVEIIPSDISADRQTVTVNLAAAIQEHRLEKLDKLRPGDTVRVPRKGAGAGGSGNLVYIFGSIGRQGPVPLEQASDLFSLVTQSGGPGGDADLRRVQIVRRSGPRYEHLQVDLGRYLHKSDPAGNVPLRAGDTVYLPSRRTRDYFFRALGIGSSALALAASILALSR